jgi:glycosyltransferase involved in cell wall biosynthesis
MTKLGKDFEPVFASKESGDLLDRLNNSHIKAYTVDRKGVLGLNYIAAFIKIIKSEKIDLLHLNTLTPFCKYAGIAGFIKRVPVVWVIRENPLISRSKRLKLWLKLLSSRIVFVDRDTREKLLPETDKNVDIIYNGVDTGIFKPSKSDYLYKKLSLDADQRLIGYIGSITKRKGLEYLVRAMPAIKKDQQKVKLIVIGNCKKEDEPYFSQIRAIIEDYSLQKDVYFTGQLQDVREALNSLDIVALASLEERCSRTLLEALACGKAVVATRVGGTPEIVEDGRNGFLVEAGSEKQIEEAVLKILSDNTLRQKMEEQGRILAENKFDIQNNINRMRKLYRGIK